MKIKNVMLFCYNFPHKKTQDFIIRLLAEGYKIKYVLAAPWQKLNIQKSAIRIAPENLGLIPPRVLCKTFSIDYIEVKHNSQKALAYLKNHPVNLGIISGARILSTPIILALKRKIINIHPGLLPEVRGIDTLLWSIKKDLPIGISAHLISPKIDSGRLIYKEKLTLKKTDSLIDVSLRLLEKQPDILSKALKILKISKMSNLKNLDFNTSFYNTKMTTALEKETVDRFSQWLKKYSH